MKTNNLFYKTISIGSIIFGALFFFLNFYKSWSGIGGGLCSSLISNSLSNNILFSLIFSLFGIVGVFIKKKNTQKIFIFLFFIIIIIYVFKLIYIKNIYSVKDRNCIQNSQAVALPR